MLKHEFGMMMADPEPGQKFEEYDPEKYDCIAVDDECVQAVIEFVQDIEFYMMSLVLECCYYAGEMGSMISETTLDFAVFMDVNRQDVLDRMNSKFNQ